MDRFIIEIITDDHLSKHKSNILINKLVTFVNRYIHTKCIHETDKYSYVKIFNPSIYDDFDKWMQMIPHNRVSIVFNYKIQKKITIDKIDMDINIKNKLLLSLLILDNPKVCIYYNYIPKYMNDKSINLFIDDREFNDKFIKLNTKLDIILHLNDYRIDNFLKDYIDKDLISIDSDEVSSEYDSLDEELKLLDEDLDLVVHEKADYDDIKDELRMIREKRNYKDTLIETYSDDISINSDEISTDYDSLDDEYKLINDEFNNLQYEEVDEEEYKKEIDIIHSKRHRYDDLILDLRDDIEIDDDEISSDDDDLDKELEKMDRLLNETPILEVDDNEINKEKSQIENDKEVFNVYTGKIVKKKEKELVKNYFVGKDMNFIDYI